MNGGGSVSVAAVLGDGDITRTAAVLERRLREVNVAETTLAQWGGLPTSAYRSLDQRVVEALRTLLDVEIGDVLLGGWRKYRELVAAAERTRDVPGPPEDLVLAEHEIVYTQQPSVEVLVDGAPVARLAFELAVSLVLRGVIAVVDRGRLVALRGGDLVAGAKLTLRDVELAKGEIRCLAGAVLRLGAGVSLVGGEVTSEPSSAAQGVVPSQPAAPAWERAVTPGVTPDYG